MQVPRTLLADSNLIVVDKPAGINVHAGHGQGNEPSLQYIIEKQLGQPVFLVHRLDRDTSGVLLIAKTEAAKKHLQRQFERRSIQKTYLALVRGHLEHRSGIIDLPLARSATNPLKRAVRGRGKAAITEYQSKQRYHGYDLVEVKPRTGRTHQIRVHLAHIGHPIVGDRVYGSTEPKLSRQFLHASALSFTDLNNQRTTVSSPLPPDLKQFLKAL